MNTFTDMVDLAAERLGGQALFATDDFFAPKENLLKPGRGIFIADKYTENGKWMDGWESRRKRVPGHDYCLIKLGLPGIIHGFDIDTNHFLGNYPEHASLEACALEGDPTLDQLERAAWTEILPVSKLEGGSQNLFAVASRERWTHLRFHIYPDGGVARLRVHGQVAPNWDRLLAAGDLIDLAAIQHGGIALICNDMFFSHKNNLIMPGRSSNMGDGWETKRKREPGHDWLILQLGRAGTIKQIEVDTNHFKGNFPDRCAIDVCYAPGAPTDLLAGRSIDWLPLLRQTKLEAHKQHHFDTELQDAGVVTHAKLSIFPDGGISRLRLYGHAQP